MIYPLSGLQTRLRVLKFRRLQFIAQAVAEAARRKRPRGPNRKRERGYDLRKMDDLSDRDFTRMFRVSRARFADILGKISPKLERDVQQAKNSSGGPITPKTKLAVTLRWLAGGCYLDICFGFGVANGSFYNAERGPLWPTVRALDEAYDLKFPCDDLDRLQQIGAEFGAHSRGILQNCVGAVDGLLIRTRAPYWY